MSEEKKELQTYVTYDTKSVIKDIELSASYIPALQNIVSNLIIEVSYFYTCLYS